MSGSKDFARVVSLTKSGTGGCTGGTRTRRSSDSESKEMNMVNMVDDVVLVIESNLECRKLKSAMNGSRCWTSARIAKRISGDISKGWQSGLEQQLYNCLDSL